MTESEKKEEHEKKMEVRRFYGGILLFLFLAGIDIFYKTVPMYLYGFAVIVLGIRSDAISTIFGKK